MKKKPLNKKPKQRKRDKLKLKLKSKKVQKHLILIGLTALSLFIFAFFVKIAELLGMIQLSIVSDFFFWGMSALDVWLIIAIFPFGFTFYFIYFLLYKFKLLEI